MQTLKVACLTGTMSGVQRDLGVYGLRHDVNAFWAQFTQWYNKVAASLRKHTRNDDRIVKETDVMDVTSQKLYNEMMEWLKEM